MNLESIIQSGVSQKEKDQLYSNTCVRTLENGAEEFIYRAAVEKET